jgi:hypothetical protein
VNHFAVSVYRASLRAYPPAFRRDYEDALVQSFMDQHQLGGAALWQVALREIVDVASTAPRMRGESPMARLIATIAGLTIAVLAAVFFGPPALLLVAAGCTAIWFGFLRNAPTAERAVRRAVSPRWFIAGGIALATAIAIPIIDGGELNQVWWSVMMLLLVAGVGLLVTAVSLVVSSRRPSY